MKKTPCIIIKDCITYLKQATRLSTRTTYFSILKDYGVDLTNNFIRHRHIDGVLRQFMRVTLTFRYDICIANILIIIDQYNI